MLRSPLSRLRRVCGAAPRVRCAHAAAPRPRATTRSPSSPRRSLEARLVAGVAAGAALLAAPFLYHIATGDLTLTALRERVADAWVGLAQVGGEELVALLPAWDSYAVEGGGGGGGGGGDAGTSPTAALGAAAGGPLAAVGRAGSALARPRCTVVLGWEGVCVDLAYDPKSGFRTVPRPGLAPLLLALAAAGAEVVVWSPTSPSAVVSEQLAGVVAAAVAPLDVGSYTALQARMEEAYARARAHEDAAAARERRPPRPMLPITREDRLAQYSAHALRIAAVLGSEHTVPWEGGGGGGAAAAAANARPVAALTHGRAPWDVAVVDAAPRAAAGLPARAAPRGAQHLAVPAWRRGEEEGEDPTLFLLAEMMLWFGGWRRAAERRAGAGAGAGGAAPFSGALGAEGTPATNPEASLAAFFEHAVGGREAFSALLEEEAGGAAPGGGLARALLVSAREQLRLRLLEESAAAAAESAAAAAESAAAAAAAAAGGGEKKSRAVN
jgi:hypothetical protein